MTVCVRFGKTVTEYSGSDTIEIKRGQAKPVPFSFPAGLGNRFFPLLCEYPLQRRHFGQNYKLKH